MTTNSPSGIAPVMLALALTGLNQLHAGTIHFDYDTGQADVEVFSGATSSRNIDLTTLPRTKVAPNVWMSLQTTAANGATITAHLNDRGLGAIGDPGANQLSAGENIILTFFDAETGGNPANVELQRLDFGYFGGTSAPNPNDGMIVKTGVLPDITINANTDVSGSGWAYTQTAPTSGQGDGELVFTETISVSTITLTDDSQGTEGGSRFRRLVLDMAPPNGTPTNGDPVPDPSAPNIIFIMVDDMGYSDIGCYGSEIQTPNIDSLAAEGLRFRQFYNNAKCETTRSCLLSGLYHGRAGLKLQTSATLAEAARSGGYRTYVSGKWHMSSTSGGDGYTPTDRGFHHFYGIYAGSSNYFPSGISSTTVSLDTQEANQFISPYDLSNFTAKSSTISNQTSFPTGYYMTDAIGDHAVAFVNDAAQNHPERPFFLYLSFNAPHTPLQAPVDLINKYRGTYVNKGWDVMRQEKWQRQIESGLVDPSWTLSNLPEDIPRWDDLSPAAKDKEDHRRAVYAAMVDSVDQNIGKVLAQLDTLGISNNTLVMFCSDNGAQPYDNPSAAQRLTSPDSNNSPWNPGVGWAAYSNAPFRSYKQSKHQGGISTPFVVRWPAVIAPGQTTDQPAHVVDIMATLVDVGSADYNSLTTPTGAAPAPMDGQSLLPIFDGTGRPTPDFWAFEYDTKDFGVIQGDWKLVSFRSGPWRLFNLAEDRTETRNLIRENPAKAQELAALYDSWASDTYGNSSHIYANRKTIPNLGVQHMRYEVVDTGQLYSNPPVGFTVTDIGTMPASDVSELHEVWTVESSGPVIGGTADACNFTHIPFFGDGELVVRIESFTGATASGAAGLMLRESLAADSRFVMTTLGSGGDCTLLARATNGEAATTSASLNFTAPVFLRLSRAGNIFTSSCSSDGLAWTTIASTELALTASPLAGFATASGSSAQPATVVFRELEHLDLGQYPSRLRRIDGLPEVLGYALGAADDVNALDRLPRSTLSDGSPQFPQLVFTRRPGLAGVSLSIQRLDPSSNWIDDQASWNEISVTPHPDGVSENVTLRRDTNVLNEPRNFFRLGSEVN